MSKRRDSLGLFGMLKEMFRDEPEEYVSPEEIDRQVEVERLDQESEDLEEVVDYIEAGSERAIEEQRDAWRILRDMQWACVALSLIYLVGAFFVPEGFRYSAGVLVGLTVAIVMLKNMFESIADAIVMESHDATVYMRRKVTIRYFVIFAVIVGTILLGGKYMGLGAILSVMNMKFSAYLQPLTNRIRRKILRKGR